MSKAKCEFSPNLPAELNECEPQAKQELSDIR